MLIAFGIAIMSAFAFNTPAAKTDKKFGTEYYFNPSASNTYAELIKPVNWSTSGVSCNVSGNDVCTMNYPGTRADFDNHIALDFANKGQILTASSSKKN